MWPPAKPAPSRTSSTWASAAGCVTVRARGASLSSGPRLSSTMRAIVGGLGARSAFASFTNASTVISASIGLKRRSKPSVEEVLADMPRPHSEPATCPGKSSTPLSSPPRRSCSER